MNIVRDSTNTQVQIVKNGAIVQTLSYDVTANLNKRRNGILIEDVRGRKYEIFTNQVDEVEKQPSPPVKFFGGTTSALWDLLFDPAADPAFNELHIKFASGGGGGVDETNIKIIPGPTYTVLSTDYILWVTGNCTITLPLIPTVAIAFPIRIFSRDALTRVNPSGADTIDGGAFVNIGKYSMYTFRAGQAGDWGLGD